MSGTIAASDDSLDASPQYPLSFTGDNADMVVDVIYIHGGKRVAQNGDQRGSRPGIPTERCPWSFFKNRRYSDRTFIDVLSEKTPEAQRWLDQWLPVANDIEEKDKGRVEAEPNPAHERTDRTIIWVTDDSTAPALIQTLRHADRLAHTWNGGRRRAVDPTYGVIHVRSQRHSTLYTSLLVVGQGVCYWVLRNYDQSRNGFYLSSNSGSSAPAQTILPDLLRTPSTSTFVIVALVYGIFAMLQYHINRNDHYQQLLLVTGLAAGLLLSPSVPFSVPESPVSLHTFAVTTSVALACSACGHWIWRTFFTTRDARLERKIQEWREDARGMVKERPVIRLAELV